jgi:glycosyltransferase involved in cell wall biosynthesis
MIGRTIQSILNQTYTDFELIIVDDGSTDNTTDVVANFKDKRIRYIKKENGERGAARNYGANISKGKYLNFFDSDDVAYENHLKTANNLINDAGNPEVFHLNYEIRGYKNNIVSKVITNINTEISTGNILSCNGVFIRKDTFHNYLFSENRALSGSEDYLLWLRLCFDFPFIHEKTITSVITIHDSRSVVTMNKQKLIKRIEALILELEDTCGNKNEYIKVRSKIISNVYLYLSLHLALINAKWEAITYLYKAAQVNLISMFSLKLVVILRKLISN